MAALRVTGGDLSGRRLYVPKTGLRPTTGRVREALFSMLGSVKGAAVLDLFCGSGALGIEALSRGAREGTFVDVKPAAADRNLKAMGKALGKDRWTVVKSDVLDFLERRALEDPTARYDLVLCDPPYTLAADLLTGLGPSLAGVLAEGGRVVLETSTRNPLRLHYPLIKERAYGDTLLLVYAAPGRGRVFE
jgi:16S rRNA (guanine966-N2)-methyltransferase